jgi:hypothetical protein
MLPLMSKQQINIVLILDFDIRGFFGFEGILHYVLHGLIFGQFAISTVQHKNSHSLCSIVRYIFMSGQS